MKAGRPSTNKEEKPSTNKEEKPEWLEQEWTAEERSILAATKHAATSMLAIAVVKQWIRDGKPASEYEGIKIWLQIIKNSLSDKDKKESPQKVEVLHE